MPAAGEAGGGTPRDAQAGGGRDLAVAIVTGVLLAAAFVASLLASPLLFGLLVLAVVVAGLVEAASVFEACGRPVARPALLVGAVACCGGAYLAGPPGQAAGIMVLVAGTGLWLLGDRQRRRVADTLGATLLLGLWVGFLGSYALLLVARPEHALAATLVTIGAAVLADIGAYAAGSVLGRHLIAPVLSPHKTWEGLAGGVAAAALAAVLLLAWLVPAAAPLPAAGFGAAVGLGAFAGDLFESMVKRDLGVKDLGRLLPGHGGILDRVDGLLVALPVGYYMLGWVV